MDTNTQVAPQSASPPKRGNRIISVETLQEVVNYLSKQPFGEVHQIINQLLQLPAEK